MQNQTTFPSPPAIRLDDLQSHIARRRPILCLQPVPGSGATIPILHSPALPGQRPGAEPLAVDQGNCRIYRVVGDAYLGFCERPEAVVATGNVIVTLVTPEVDAWYERLRERGILFERPPAVNATYHIYHCFAHDPDGYLVEIQRFLDPII